MKTASASRPLLLLQIAVGIAVASTSASASELQHSHTLRRQATSKHTRRHRLRGAAREEVVADALERLPTKIGKLFSAFRTSPSALTATPVLDQLQAVYTHAQSIEDTIGLDCLDQRSRLSHEARAARSSLARVESQLAQARNRTATLQDCTQRTLAAIQSFRAQFDVHRSLCQQNEKRFRADIAAANRDLPRAREIVQTVTQSCSSGAQPPSILQCTLPSGEIAATFESADVQRMAAGLGGAAEELLSRTLNNALGTHANPTKSKLSLASLNFKRHRSAVKKPLGPSFVHIPIEWCTKATAPSCPAFLDGISFFLGGMVDMAENLTESMPTEAANCDESLRAYEASINSMKQEADGANIALAGAVAEQGSLADLQQERQAWFEDLSREFDDRKTQCAETLADTQASKAAAKKVYYVVGSTPAEASAAAARSFLGDCEVTDWVRGHCSKPCGPGRVRNLTRSPLPGAQGAQCPSFHLTRSCREKPCHETTPGAGIWSEWSECSAKCNGGSRTRTNSGSPSSESVQVEGCNADACDRDCELAEWSAWSNCSVALLVGHQLRTRHVRYPALGKGKCPVTDSHERREAITCFANASDVNVTETPPRCAASLDLVFVLDGSGSIGAEGFNAAKQFVAKFFARTLILGEGLGQRSTIAAAGHSVGRFARMALVAFGAAPTIVQEITTDRTAFLTSLNALTWPAAQAGAAATNTAGALAVTRRMLNRQVTADSSVNVVVITDGPPSSPRLMSTEVKRLMDCGARLSFVGVGPGAGGDLRQWASWPERENFIQVPSFTALDAPSKITKLVAALCPVVAFD